MNIFMYMVHSYYSDACSNSGCSDICTVVEGQAVCSCESGAILSNDGVSCLCEWMLNFVYVTCVHLNIQMHV